MIESKPITKWCVMDSFESNGFLLLQSIVSNDAIDELQTSINELSDSVCAPGVRHLLRRSRVVRRLAKSPTMLAIATKYLRANAKPVKAIFFDKTPASNWYVTWHQDLTIAVKEKIAIPDYGPWSVKDELPHVQPPATILEKMLAIRVHLDDSPEENGAISFLPGSHKHGKLTPEEICAWKNNNPSICCAADRGDVIVMRPLILHSSAKASRPEHRRVLHIEYAATDLPGGLRWSEASGLDGVELVMAIEEEFGLEIPDTHAERILTVGDAFDYLRMRLDSTPARECLSQRIFYKLRRALIENYPVKRQMIDPDTKLTDILSIEELESGWPYLPLFMELNTPDFRRSNELLGFKLSDTIVTLTVRELVFSLIALNSEAFAEERDSDQEVWRRLVDVIVRQANVNRDEVVPSASFTRDLGIC